MGEGTELRAVAPSGGGCASELGWRLVPVASASEQQGGRKAKPQSDSQQMQRVSEPVFMAAVFGYSFGRFASPQGHGVAVSAAFSGFGQVRSAAAASAAQ